jgi:hypothetical protein
VPLFLNKLSCLCSVPLTVFLTRRAFALHLYRFLVKSVLLTLMSLSHPGSWTVTRARVTFKQPFGQPFVHLP